MFRVHYRPPEALPLHQRDFLQKCRRQTYPVRKVRENLRSWSFGILWRSSPGLFFSAN